MDALNKPAGKRLSLPGGLTFSIEYNQYLVGQEPAALSTFPVLRDPFPLKVPRETPLPGWNVEATIMDISAIKSECKRANAPSETITTLPPIEGSVKGLRPFTNYSSPSPSKERGTKGVRLIDNPFTACFDLDKTGDKLVVRSRQPGDRFQPLGMNEFKKLGEYMIDAKIPRAWRQRIPVICSPSQILWVVGWRIDDRVKVTENTRQVLCLRFNQR